MVGWLVQMVNARPVIVADSYHFDDSIPGSMVDFVRSPDTYVVVRHSIIRGDHGWRSECAEEIRVTLTS